MATVKAQVHCQFLKLMCWKQEKGKFKDLRNFNKGQILTTRQVGHLVGCSQYAMVSTSKVLQGKSTSDRVVDIQASMMSVRSKCWPVWSDSTEELLLAVIESCQNTVHCSLLQTGQCPCWP